LVSRQAQIKVGVGRGIGTEPWGPSIYQLSPAALYAMLNPALFDDNFRLLWPSDPCFASRSSQIFQEDGKMAATEKSVLGFRFFSGIGARSFKRSILILIQPSGCNYL